MKHNLLFLGVALLCIVAALIVSKKGVKVKTSGEIIELKNFKVKTGQHCESSAMMNALSYQGVDISESMINGLGSAISFMFSKEDTFPFIGGRTLNLNGNFQKSTGIKIVEIQPATPQEAYDKVKYVLKQGIPVVLRLNMRYLPYLWNGKYGNKYTDFGWHFVTLAKIDEKEGLSSKN